MMETWICYKCGGYNVFETMFVRINRLACIIDTYEDLREPEDAKGWCEDCYEYVELIETDVPLYAEI